MARADARVELDALDPALQFLVAHVIELGPFHYRVGKDLDPRLSGNGLGRHPVVPGDHYRADARGTGYLQRLRDVRTQRVLERGKAQEHQALHVVLGQSVLLGAGARLGHGQDAQALLR